MYSILINDKKDKTIYRFLQVKKEITKTINEEVEDPSTHEVRQVEKTVGTGEYETVRYTTEDKDEFEKKFIELLGTYNKNELIPVNVEGYDVDVLWKTE